MRVYSKYQAIKDSACYYARELGIDDYKKVRIHIYRLPHPHPKQGYIEYPINGKPKEISLFVKLDEEREITLAHEMVHMDQMARGDLNYNDDKVFWKGKEYDYHYK